MHPRRRTTARQPPSRVADLAGLGEEPVDDLVGVFQSFSSWKWPSRVASPGALGMATGMVPVATSNAGFSLAHAGIAPFGDWARSG